ncbi:MAG: LLM class flavin-dependent oxidoreductase, partial [Chloroflexota bacterium]
MSVRIGLSIGSFPFSSARAMWRWIEACEDSPIDSIWQNDRLVSSEPFLEPLTALAALAGGTKRLKFGMNVLVLPFRDPIVVAKQCATIDFLSDG